VAGAGGMGLGLNIKFPTKEIQLDIEARRIKYPLPDTSVGHWAGDEPLSNHKPSPPRGQMQPLRPRLDSLHLMLSDGPSNGVT